MAAGVDETRQTTVNLAVAGVVMLAMIGLITLLYVNFPPDVETPYGVHRHAVSFFRLVWNYPTFTMSPWIFQVLAAGAILALWGAYLFGMWTVSRLPEDEDYSVLIPRILGFALVFNAALLFYFPPVLSGDVFHYAIQGRLYGLHSMNPYAISASTVTDDPFWPLTIWREGTTQYGPMWIQLASLCARLGDGSVLLTIFIFKLLATLANVGGALLVVLLVRRLTGGDGVVPLLFYAWNPILLIESAGGAHSDVTMMFLALLGVLLFAQNRFFLGVAVLFASAMTKYITLLLLVFVLVHLLARQSSVKRVGLALRAGLFMALLLILFYAPFVSGAPDPTQLFAGVSSSLNPMPNNAGLLLRQGIGGVLQIAGFNQPEYVSLILNTAFGILVVFMLAGLASAKTTLADVMGSFGLAALIYSFLIYAGSFPWYLVAPFSALAVAPPTRATSYVQLLSIGLGIGFTLQVTMLIPK